MVHHENAVSGIVIFVQLTPRYQQVLHDDLLQQSDVAAVDPSCLSITFAEVDGDPLGQALLDLPLPLSEPFLFLSVVEVGAQKS